MLQLICFSPTL